MLSQMGLLQKEGLMVVKNVAPELPYGVKVGDKPENIELDTRCSTKYKSVIDTLKIIDSSKTVQMDVKNFPKGKIQGIKQAIRKNARIFGFKSILKFAVKDEILHIWSNR